MSDYIEDPEVNQLIYEKGQELISISRIRIQKLEEQVRGKDAQIEDLRGRLAQLEQDFNYNLGLIDGRDEELTDLEGKVETLKNVLRDKDAETEDLRIALRTAEERNRAFDDRTRRSDRFLQENRETLREQIATLQWEKADFLKKKEDEIKALKADFEQIIRDKDLELLSLTKSSSVSYDSALRGKEEQIQTLKSQLAQSQAQNFTLRDELESSARRSGNAELLEERLRVLQEQSESAQKKLEAALKDKTEAFYKADQEARSLRFAEQTLRQEVAHLNAIHEDEKVSYSHELSQLREQQERELQYLTQIKEASVEKLQATHAAQQKRLQEKLSESLGDNERLAQQCQALKARLEDRERTLQDEIDTARDEVQSELLKTRKTITDLKSQVAQRDDEVAVLTSTLERTKAALTTQERELQRLENELVISRQRGAELERSLDVQSRQKQSSLAAELDLAQRKIRLAEEESGALKEEISHMRGDFELSERENDELKKLVAEMKGDLEALRRKSTLEQERGSATLAYKEKIGKQEMEIANLTLQVRDLEVRAQSAEDAQRRMAADVAQKDKDLARVKLTVQSLRTELEKVTLERDELMEVSGTLRAELSMMRGSVEVEPRSSASEALARMAEDRRRLATSPYTQPIDELGSSLEIPPAQGKLPKYDRFEEVSPPVRDSHLSTLKRKISQVKSELDQNFDLSAQGAKPRVRLFARLEDTPTSSLANTQSFDDKE